jgi:hypothetical protein
MAAHLRQPGKDIVSFAICCLTFCPSGRMFFHRIISDLVGDWRQLDDELKQ